MCVKQDGVMIILKTLNFHEIFRGLLVTHRGYKCSHPPLVIYIIIEKKGEKIVAGNYIT